MYKRQPNKDAQRIEKLIRNNGKISGYQLSDGTVLSKAEGVALAKQGGIRGVAIACLLYTSRPAAKSRRAAHGRSR